MSQPVSFHCEQGFSSHAIGDDIARAPGCRMNRTPEAGSTTSRSRATTSETRWYLRYPSMTACTDDEGYERRRILVGSVDLATSTFRAMGVATIIVALSRIHVFLCLECWVSNMVQNERIERRKTAITIRTLLGGHSVNVWCSLPALWDSIIDSETSSSPTHGRTRLQLQ